MSERRVNSRLSSDVIAYLAKRGMTLTAIAEAMKVSKSFVSRVRAGARGLTIDHLIALERQLGEPLPLLLLEATPVESVTKELRPLYRSTERLLRTSYRKPKRASQRRTKAA